MHLKIKQLKKGGLPYNWIFNDPNFQPVDEVLNFYSKSFLKRQLDFSDTYVVLNLGVDELRKRKGSDENRKRSNFDLRLIEPQRGYFESLRLGGHIGLELI